MAISRNRVSKSIESSLRIKQRDYTIPVRLNQRLPPSTNRLNLAQESANKSTRNNAFKFLKINHQRKVNNNNKMILPISEKAAKRFPVSSSSSTLVVVACAILTINSNYCNCDTKSSLYSSPLKNRPSSPSSSSSVDYLTNLSQKENLLTTLSDNIERQHFKMKPARAFGLKQRPSKFDSEEYLGELNLDAGLDFIKKKAQPLASIKKVDDSMRQILRMHEYSPTSGGHQNGQISGGGGNLQGKGLSPVAALSSQTADLEQVKPAAEKRWRKLARSPILINSLDPNKVVSKMLAYVTPLVSSKLADHSTILSQNFMDAKNSTSNGSINRIRLHPFAARSNNQASLSKSMLSFRPYASATTPPETSSLVRPDFGTTKMGSNNIRYSFSTPPSTLINSIYKSDTSGLKQDGSSVDSIINDLMADSSDNTLTSSIAAASAGISSQLGSSSDENTRRPDASHGRLKATTTTTTSGSKQPAKNGPGSILKKGANHLAQNYFQNSFRDLITLSQLPILSTASTTSTAPSVLEKKRKPNKVDKVGSKYRRRRLIEDLYRYAYMLSTGVRNKRDPLEALGSSPPNHLISSSTSQKSVLSQRSINQLMASNHNQLLNYVRKLRSMLTLGPMNKAKPRGVMWDMATDPSLAVTVFHLLERASVALPLGFLLLPAVQMIRHPLNGLNLGRILPARASHRSVDIEELAKRLDIVDKMLSRALRSTHRESLVGK